MEYNCEPPFWDDPSILYRYGTLQYRPTCEHSSFNFLARIIILSFVVGCIGSIFGGLPFMMVVLLFGTITSCAIVLMTPLEIKSPREERREERKERREERHMEHDKKKCHDNCERTYNTYHELPFVATVDPSRSSENFASDTKEHFVNGGSAPNSVQPNGVIDPYGTVEVDAAPYSGPSFPDYTPPTSKNLFMNVLLDEYKYNPDRPEAAPVGNPSIKQTMDDFFRVHWFSDPTDVFGKTQNQRQFVTQPSTTVPNDQGSFANWLYKIPGKTCKEGGRDACLAGTDGAAMPWLSQSS